MSQEEEEKIDQPESDKGKDDLEPSPPSVESNKQTTTSEHTTDHCNKIEQHEKLYWGKFRMADLIQLGGVVLTFLALITSIIISAIQIGTSNKALDKADTSNMLVKQGILSSDSSTKEALRISDSSLAIAGKSLVLTSQNIRTIRDNARTELRAYVQADSVYFNKFNVGKGGMIINLRLANVGKTPAYDLVILGSPKLGGTGIYDADFGTLKDTASSLFIGGNGGYLTWTTIYSTLILSEEDSVRISEGKIFLGYFAKIFYTDKFGDRDSLRICRIYDSILRSFVLCNNYYEIQNPN